MSADITLILPFGNDWWLTVANSSMHFKFKPDAPNKPGEGKVKDMATSPIPESVFEFSNLIGMGPAELQTQIMEQALLQMPDGAPLGPEFEIQPMFEGVQQLWVGDAVVATAEELEAADILAAMEETITAEEIAEAVLLALAGAAFTLRVKRYKHRKATKELPREQPKVDLAAISSIPKSVSRPVRLFDASDSFNITFFNETGSPWSLTDLLDPTDPGGAWHISSSPPQVLPGGIEASSGTLSMYQNFVFLGLGPQTLHAVYSGPDGVFFGAQIVVPLQVYHMGPSPYCQIKYPGHDDWFWPGPDSTTAQHIDFNGYKAYVEASGGGTTFTISVRLSKAR